MFPFLKLVFIFFGALETVVTNISFLVSEESLLLFLTYRKKTLVLKVWRTNITFHYPSREIIWRERTKCLGVSVTNVTSLAPSRLMSSTLGYVKWLIYLPKINKIYTVNNQFETSDTNWLKTTKTYAWYIEMIRKKLKKSIF